MHSSPWVSFWHLSVVYKVLAPSFKRFSVGQFLRLLRDVSFINSRPLMLKVVQFSFAIFYSAIFRTLRLSSPYHTFIFRQTIVTLCLWCFFVHSSSACLLYASLWVNSSVILDLLLFSVSCFVLTYNYKWGFTVDFTAHVNSFTPYKNRLSFPHF